MYPPTNTEPVMIVATLAPVTYTDVVFSHVASFFVSLELDHKLVTCCHEKDLRYDLNRFKEIGGRLRVFLVGESIKFKIAWSDYPKVRTVWHVTNWSLELMSLQLWRIKFGNTPYPPFLQALGEVKFSEKLIERLTGLRQQEAWDVLNTLLDSPTPMVARSRLGMSCDLCDLES